MLKFHKTPKKQRTTYTYVTATNEKITIYPKSQQANEPYRMANQHYNSKFPKQNSEYIPKYLEQERLYVSDEIIKELHKADDRFVDSNIRTHKIPNYKSYNTQTKKFEQIDFNQKPSNNWILSLDYIPDNGSENDNTNDHNKVQHEATVFASQREENPALDRLHELIASFPKNWQKIYQLVILTELPMTQVARRKEVSESSIRKIMNKIKVKIASDEELKNLFR